MTESTLQAPRIADMPTGDSGDELSDELFRRTLGRYPTGVAAVTTISSDAVPLGTIVGSFSSVSLRPPLVGFFVDRTSTSWRTIRATGRFCVNMLRHGQEDVCRVLATKRPDKMAQVAWQPSRTGLPVIEDVVAAVECDLYRVDEAGDHYGVLGSVRSLSVLSNRPPLVFLGGEYGRFYRS